MLRVERLRGTLVVGLLQDVVVPGVATVRHRRVVVGVPDDDDLLDARHVVEHTVDLLLDRRRLALAAGGVRGDQELGVRELHPLGHGVRREAAEDEVVRRADPSAGEHRDHDLGDHRQEDPHDVALLDALVLERVRELLDVAVEVGVGDVALLALLAAPVEGHAVAVAGLDVPVDAVVADVELPAGEPLVEGGLRLVEHLVPALGPVEVLGLLLPPGLRVLRGLLVDRGVVQQRVLTELVGRVEGLDLLKLLQLLLELFSGWNLRARFHLSPPYVRLRSPFAKSFPQGRVTRFGARSTRGADSSSRRRARSCFDYRRPLTSRSRGRAPGDGRRRLPPRPPPHRARSPNGRRARRSCARPCARPSTAACPRCSPGSRAGSR